jgi:RNA polymerase sigma factor (sigma-70 family)
MAEDPRHDPLQAPQEPAPVRGSGESSTDRLDPGAVSRLFREHNRALVGYLTARLRSEQDAKEVAQEAYVRLLRLHEPGTASLFRAYLFKTAANLAIDRLRWRNVRRRAEQAHLFAELGATTSVADEPERRAAAQEDARVLHQCLQELPPKCRRVFELHRLEGRSQQQVATDLGFSERMVRRYVTYALVYCRLRLTGLGLEEAREQVKL